jgi:hypothetical protein
MTETPTIQSTREYNKFDYIVGNRNINQKKIQRIMTDINAGMNLLPYCPIIVYYENGKFYIVDGQHRFEVAKQIDLPVYYVLANELDLKQIAMLNSRQDKWTQPDFLRCYKNIGLDDYVILDNFLKENAVGISTGADLLMFGKLAKGAVAQKFRDGEFKVNFLNETIALLNASDNLFSRYSFYRDRNLLTAVQELQNRGLCDFEVLRAKIAKTPNMMDKQGTSKDYIFNIERVYNHNNKIRQVIF